MCGIAGFYNSHMNTDARITAINGMNERMFHRGPDAGGYYIDDISGLTFGHRRLSIQDLSENGAQPITSQDGRLIMVYNGEIYNALKIRDRLESEDGTIVWRGTSDTEILLEAIAKYGITEALKLTKGMFALAVYDKKLGKLHLARDRVGEKPLYYGHVRSDLVFASDIDVIRAYPGFDNEIDTQALGMYLRYSFIPTPMSVYKGIYKLKPGTVMTIDLASSESSTESYYDLRDEYAFGKTEDRFKGDYNDAVDELESVLRSAVKSQMISDVPLGAFLSGGIDSSVCVALMQSVANAPVKTFTIGFEDKQYDESEYAACIAKHLGTDHTSLMISEKDLMDVVPKMAEIFTEPFADSSQIPTYLVSKLARSKVTVSLSGDAGDELFCGYNTYWKVANLYNKLSPLPKGIKRLAGSVIAGSGNNTLYRAAHCLKANDIANLHEAVCYDMTRMSRMLGTSHQDNKQELLLAEELRDKSAGLEDEMMLRDLLRYHPDDILVKVDRAGMAVSLENRVPMLDKDVLKFAFSLPVDYKLASDNEGSVVNKRILRDVLYRHIPKELMDRPKKGFSVPLKKWLTEGPVHDRAWEELNESELVKAGLIDKNGLTKLMNNFLSKGENTSLLWSVIVLEQWYRKYE